MNGAYYFQLLPFLQSLSTVVTRRPSFCYWYGRRLPPSPAFNILSEPSQSHTVCRPSFCYWCGRLSPFPCTLPSLNLHSHTQHAGQVSATDVGEDYHLPLNSTFPEPSQSHTTCWPSFCYWCGRSPPFPAFYLPKTFTVTQSLRVKFLLLVWGKINGLVKNLQRTAAAYIRATRATVCASNEELKHH